MQPTTTPPPRSSAVRRYGPIIAIVGVIAVIAVVVVATKGGDDKAASGGSATTTVPTANRPGVLSFSQAKAEGKEGSIDWGDRCDTTTGKLKYPSFFAGECYAPFTGDNGGATATGVTSNSIKVVFYQAQPTDPILNYITQAVKVDDTNAQTAQTMQDWMTFYDRYYETYGRKIELVPFTATGTAIDEVAARADANTIAQDIKPFAVWGGPILTPTFGDELAARGVLCISCGPGSSYDYFTKRAPYLWGLGILPEQGQTHVVEYLAKELANGNAEHAGDPAMHARKRTFGLIYISTSDQDEKVTDRFEANLAAAGVPLAARLAYKSPIDLQNGAPGLIAKLKDAGVTSLLFAGDPIAPQPLTQAATAQEYFPEWIITGSALTDTAAFARTYDQKQWAHAFGVSFGAARSDPRATGSKFLYRWFFGQDAPASTAAATAVINPALFFPVIQGMGPDVSAQNFEDTVFAANATTHAITQPSLSYGNKGIWPQTDYSGVDDATEIWWDPTASGPDEIQRQGQGLYQYVDGGKRYFPGEWPKQPTRAFDPNGAVSIYPTPPASEQAPTYPSPAARN
jgi:hypothetical protein